MLVKLLLLSFCMFLVVFVHSTENPCVCVCVSHVCLCVCVQQRFLLFFLIY